MQESALKTAVFGGGCFWCTEAIFCHLKGVSNVMPGYSGGSKDNPTYDEVCAGSTGHIEVVKMDYDPKIISFSDLLTVFFNTHDPTTLEKQGNDEGEQYSSVIFYTDINQKEEAQSMIRDLNERNAFDSPIVTVVRPLQKFFAAEDYHREYYKKYSNAPYCKLVVGPKLESLRERFADLTRT